MALLSTFFFNPHRSLDDKTCNITIFTNIYRSADSKQQHTHKHTCHQAPLSCCHRAQTTTLLALLIFNVGVRPWGLRRHLFGSPMHRQLPCPADHSSACGLARCTAQPLYPVHCPHASQNCSSGAAAAAAAALKHLHQHSSLKCGRGALLHVNRYCYCRCCWGCSLFPQCCWSGYTHVSASPHCVAMSCCAMCSGCLLELSAVHNDHLLAGCTAA